MLFFHKFLQQRRLVEWLVAILSPTVQWIFSSTPDSALGFDSLEDHLNPWVQVVGSSPILIDFFYATQIKTKKTKIDSGREQAREEIGG